MSSTSGEARIRRAMWKSLRTFAVVGVFVAAAIVLWSIRSQTEETVPSDHETLGPRALPTEQVSAPALQFIDITRTAGIDFVHETGAYGEHLLPETMGGGVAFFDYDNDGAQDLLLINSDHWPWRPVPAEPPTSRLYHNHGDGSFKDVSAAAGLDLRAYGMGVAVGDYNGDGFVDVFVSALGENHLFRNVDGEHFIETTSEVGVAGDPDVWSTSAAFLDYDRDGDLDLFVCNYIRWSPEIDREVDYRLTGIGRAYGPPTDFAGMDSYLYRNDSGPDGTRFTDVSEQVGIRVVHETTGQPVGKALAVHPIDVNDDGWLDLVVANDTVRNFLFLNERNGHFREMGIESGLAFDTSGLATGAMGIDAAYFANDPRLAIAIGNFANEMSSFYVSRSGQTVFSDDAIIYGIGADSRRALTFGLAFLDVDLDGYLDLLAANGHVEPEIHRVQSSQRYVQPMQLFWNCGLRCTRRYQLVDENGDLGKPRVGRGVAYADIDGDGDLDLAITAVGGRFTLLRNDQDLDHHYVRLSLRANGPNTLAIGATVKLFTLETKQTRTVMPSRSYLSQMELPLTFGLGTERKVQRVIVRWPDGEVESWSNLDIDRVHALDQGSGQPMP
jgi:hypothetical protein